jgi:hypothetical protein
VRIAEGFGVPACDLGRGDPAETLARPAVQLDQVGDQVRGGERCRGNESVAANGALIGMRGPRPRRGRRDNPLPQSHSRW